MVMPALPPPLAWRLNWRRDRDRRADPLSRPWPPGGTDRTSDQAGPAGFPAWPVAASSPRRADGAELQRLRDRLFDLVLTEVLHRSQDLNEFAPSGTLPLSLPLPGRPNRSLKR